VLASFPIHILKGNNRTRYSGATKKEKKDHVSLVIYNALTTPEQQNRHYTKFPTKERSSMPQLKGEITNKRT